MKLSSNLKISFYSQNSYQPIQNGETLQLIGMQILKQSQEKRSICKLINFKRYLLLYCAAIIVYQISLHFNLSIKFHFCDLVLAVTFLIEITETWLSFTKGANSYILIDLSKCRNIIVAHVYFNFSKLILVLLRGFLSQGCIF